MTQLDTRARASAVRMIEKYGKAVSFTHRAAGTYSAATSTVTPAETTQAGLKVYLSSPSKQQIEKGVLASSTVALIAAAAITAGDPTPGDRFTYDGKSYTVGWIDRLWSGEQVALWTVELKK
jgi:hypothetical protein